MENMTPSMACLLTVLRSLNEGKTLKQGLELYILNQPGSFADQLALWLQFQQNHRLSDLPPLQLTSDCQMALIECFESGMNGLPVLGALRGLLAEVETAAEIEIQEYLSILPIKALVPLFLFQFPAFIAIIFGPLILSVFEGIHHV